MKLLILASNYPHSGYPFAGIFNEKCVTALKNQCEALEVVVPRPFIPACLAILPKLKILNQVKTYEVRNGVKIHRPGYLWLPRLWTTFWADRMAFWCCRRYVKRLHRKVKFDAILSFNLYGGGNLAWKIGKYLNIPASGWAFGSEVRYSKTSSVGKVVGQTVNNLDLVFYQSNELQKIARALVPNSQDNRSTTRHVVLPHGIPIMNKFSNNSVREQIRKRWDIPEPSIAVLFIGRITKMKGIFELLASIQLTVAENNQIFGILIGAMPALDDSERVREMVVSDPILKKHIRIYPACSPAEVWDLLGGADIFAFPSHHEGMPNSLLEAMAAGLPAITFAIPAVQELDPHQNILRMISPFDIQLFAKELLKLASDNKLRKIIGEKACDYVRTHFDINTQMERALDEIKKLL